MRNQCNETIDSNSINLIGGSSSGGVLGIGGNPLGIITAYDNPTAVPGLPAPSPPAATVQTQGECSVIAGAPLSAGDFFTSNETGKAVETTSGFALGRVLEAGTADEIVLCVISPTSL